jgi:ferric-dicitrate binding protein FerR (iron transport regulator)
MNTDFSLLVKYLSQNLSFEEREELDNWCKITPENKQIFTEARDLRLLDDYLREFGITYYPQMVN